MKKEKKFNSEKTKMTVGVNLKVQSCIDVNKQKKTLSLISK